MVIEIGGTFVLVFEIPSRVFFGQAAANQIGSIVRTFNIQAALIVCDQGVKAAGIMTPILLSLEEAEVTVNVFDKVTANPSDSLIAEAVEYARNLSVDIVIAVGGGSSLDAAKAINILLTNDGPIQRYEGIDQVKRQTLPLIAIPTTSGTGSEVTSFSIITDSENKRKMVIGGKFVGATIAVLDPELTIKLPPAITAATGMDAMTHAIEAYFSTNASVMSDVNALKAIELLYENLEIAVKNGSDIAAREAVMLGSMLAGFAFNSALLGLAHAIAHPLGALYNIPHGVANAMVLPHVVAFNGQGNEDKIINIGRAMNLADGELSADQIAKKIDELNARISIPRLNQYIQKSDFALIVSDALVEPSLMTNPRKVKSQDILYILENAF